MFAYIPPRVFDDSHRTSSDTTATTLVKPSRALKKHNGGIRSSVEEPKRNSSSVKRDNRRPTLLDRLRRQSSTNARPVEEDARVRWEPENQEPENHEPTESAETTQEVEVTVRTEVAPSKRHSMFLSWLRGSEEETQPVKESEKPNEALEKDETAYFRVS